MLCAAHCDVNVANKYGVTPTYEAVLNGLYCSMVNLSQIDQHNIFVN